MESYEELRKRFKDLPELEKLQAEFSLKLKPDMLAFEVGNKLASFLLDIAKYLEALLYGSDEPRFMLERLMIKEKRNELFELYFKLLSLVRQGNAARFGSCEELVSFVKNSSKEWDQIKLKMHDLFKFLEKEWNKKKLEPVAKPTFYV